jgi:hypothetical protein
VGTFKTVFLSYEEMSVRSDLGQTPAARPTVAVRYPLDRDERFSPKYSWSVVDQGSCFGNNAMARSYGQHCFRVSRYLIRYKLGRCGTGKDGMKSDSSHQYVIVPVTLTLDGQECLHGDIGTWKRVSTDLEITTRRETSEVY